MPRAVQRPCLPRASVSGSQAATSVFLKCFLFSLHFIGHAEEFENVFIGFITNRPEQCGYREFFLTVNIGIHDIVDVRSKFHPRTFERYYPGTVYFSTVGVYALAKEYAGRTVQLRYHYPFSAVNHEGTPGGHIRYITQKHILYDGFKTDDTPDAPAAAVRIGRVEGECRAFPGRLECC